MDKPSAARGSTRFAVLVFPGFPMMAFSAVVEPLRAANAIASKKLYEWIVVGPENGAVVASNGIAIEPDFSAANAPAAEYIIVCSGGDADRLSAMKPISFISARCSRVSFLPTGC